MNRILYILPLLFLFQDCKKGPCITDSGSIITERRELNTDVRNIYLHDNLNLEIYVDSGNYMEVIAGANVIDNIITSVSENELTIRNENSCAQFRGFDQNQTVRLHIYKIRNLNYDGFGDITMMDTLIEEDFNLLMENGAGEVKLKVNVNLCHIDAADTYSKISIEGISPELKISYGGTAWIHAGKLKANSAIIDHNSTGDCIVNPKYDLQYTISNIGNILYYGNPKIVKNPGDGKGCLIQLK